MKCIWLQGVEPSKPSILTGILAGTVFLTPCIIFVVYIIVKDKRIRRKLMGTDKREIIIAPPTDQNTSQKLLNSNIRSTCLVQHDSQTTEAAKSPIAHNGFSHGTYMGNNSERKQSVDRNQVLSSPPSPVHINLINEEKPITSNMVENQVEHSKNTQSNGLKESENCSTGTQTDRKRVSFDKIISVKPLSVNPEKQAEDDQRFEDMPLLYDQSQLRNVENLRESSL